VAKDPYALPDQLSEFALVPRLDEKIEELAALAEPEDWEYHNTPSDNPKPVLRNYLRYTYKRIAEEKKMSVSADEQYSCMNTGGAVGSGLDNLNIPDIILPWHENHAYTRRAQHTTSFFVVMPARIFFQMTRTGIVSTKSSRKRTSDFGSGCTPFV
jgi:hypothetical protein